MKKPEISLFLPSLVGGGAERVFVQLANEFRVRGYRVDMVLASGHGPYLEELDARVKIVDLESTSVLRSLAKLVRYIRVEKPDVILSGLDHANIVAIVANLLAWRVTRCVISSRSIPSVWYEESVSIRSWLFVQMMRVTYRLADAIIVNSGTGASDLERFLRLPRERINIIFNPVDIQLIDRLSQERDPHPWCAPSSTPMVLGVGRLVAMKDFSTLIRAFTHVRSRMRCRLVILGEGPERCRLQDLIEELGIEGDACLPGFVSNPFSWMRNADVLVSSSLSEGCPNAIMQALACGTPVISTDCVGGPAELLQAGKWGRLVPVGDDSAMADAIISSFDATESPDGRRRAKDFAPERIVEQYLQVLRLVSRRQNVSK